MAVPNDGAFQAVTGATHAQIADLERYRALLADWNERLNLVGPATLPVFWDRHAYDSWQLLALAPDAHRWADLGTGAGLPGVVLAVFLKDRPGVEIHLVDSLGKRCRFLAEVAAELALPAVVHNARAESLKLSVDVVTARACAPLTKLFGYAAPYLSRGARGLFLKGEQAQAELEAARADWDVEAQLHPSLSDPRGRVVDVRSLKPRGKSRR
jgi:16S rRNA (guanine527-N7)-methyltransferase